MHVTPSSQPTPKRLRPAERPWLLPVSLLWALFLLLPAALQAAGSVYWSPNTGRIPTGLVSELNLVFEDCEPSADPIPPTVPGLGMNLRGRSENISVTNLKKQVSIIYSFAVLLEKKQAVDIPAFMVATDKGQLRVEAAHFEPGEATIGGTQISVEDIANAKLILPQGSFWAGEVIFLSYRVDVLRRYFNQLISNPDWDSTPFAIEEWDKPEPKEVGSGAEATLSIRFRTRAFAKTPGTYVLNSGQLQLNISTGTSSGFFGLQQRLQQLSISSNQPHVTIKALPSPAPAGFNGAVGAFTLTSHLVPQRVKVGEPITWTLTLNGTGNWPAIAGLPARSIPKSFEVVQPAVKRNSPQGKLFDATLVEDLIMIPKETGTFTIPALTWVYFDPKSGTYETVTIEKSEVIVEPASPSASASPATGNTTGLNAGNTPGASDILSRPLPDSPMDAKLLPDAPVAPAAPLRRPLSEGAFWQFCLIPLYLLPLAWLLLALNRALENDDFRRRRKALTELRQLLSAQAKVEDRHFLHAWRQHTATALGLAKASPAAADLLPALQALKQESLAQEWSQLWQETEAALYGATTSLPATWKPRAETLASRFRLPGFPLFSLLRPSSLFPWFFALLLSLLLGSQSLQASTAPAASASATDFYLKGDFNAARRLWEAKVARNPTDWSSRHNLGITLLQQGQNGIAVAELTAALAQNAANESVRRDFRVAAAAAGYTPEGTAFLAAEDPLGSFTRCFNPFGWQCLLAASSALLCTSLLLYLFCGYKLIRRWSAFLAHALLCISLLGGFASAFALHRYGLLANPGSAIVWQTTTLHSIPTDADTTGKNASLPAGSIGIVGKPFLGWCEIRLNQENSGWVRQEDLILIWR